MKLNANETMFLSITEVDEMKQRYLVCLAAPPHIVSDGLWHGSSQNTRTPIRSFLPLFELQVLLIFALTQICRLLLMPFKVPLFISQMMVSSVFCVHILYVYMYLCSSICLFTCMDAGWVNSAGSFCWGATGVVHEGAVSLWNSRHHHNSNIDGFCAFHLHKRCADGF